MSTPDQPPPSAPDTSQPLHVIHLMCPITHASVMQLQSVILGALSQGARSLELRMSSEGGNLAAGFAAYGLLTSLPVPLRTHNNSNVESIAIPIYLAGSERTAAKYSRFMIHPLNWGTGNGSVDHSRVVEWGDSLNFDRNRYCAIFKEVTKGAKTPINIAKHLKSEALIIGPSAAHAAGITTRAISTKNHPIPPGNIVHWWVSGF